MAAPTLPGLGDIEIDLAVAGDRLGRADGGFRITVSNGTATCGRVAVAGDVPTFTTQGLALVFAGAQSCANLRMLDRARKTGAPGPESSMLKIKGTVIRQALSDLARQALGPAAATFPADALADNAALVPPDQATNAARYFNNRKLSIFGGSNEIQRNILARELLGL